MNKDYQTIVKEYTSEGSQITTNDVLMDLLDIPEIEHPLRLLVEIIPEDTSANKQSAVFAEWWYALNGDDAQGHKTDTIFKPGDRYDALVTVIGHIEEFTSYKGANT